MGNKWDKMWSESSNHTYLYLPNTPLRMSNEKKGEIVAKGDSSQNDKSPNKRCTI